MEIRRDISLADATTMKVGGFARYFADAQSIADVQEALLFAKQEGLPLFILGGGSNVLAPDEGFSGLVLRMSLSGVTWEEQEQCVLVHASAGEKWDKLVGETTERGLWGLENLSLIPGSVGGAIVQNIGAYGVEVCEQVVSAHVLDTGSGEVRTLSAGACMFDYRESIFKSHPELLVLGATFVLSRKPRPRITYKDLATVFANTDEALLTSKQIRNAVIAIRSGKFPDLALYGTAGSFFKNPVVSRPIAEVFLLQYPGAPSYDQADGSVKLSAAWIIDHVLHMRGSREGGVGSWDAQALVIVNYGDASSSEIKKFISEIQKRAKEVTGITLEPEVVMMHE